MGIHACKDKVTLIVSEERGIPVKVATLMNLHSWDSFFHFDFFVSHLFLFLMGLVCNWLCVHHFYSIMSEGKISTFVVLSSICYNIFHRIIQLNRCIPTSVLLCNQMESGIFGPFWKKKGHVILFFFTTLALLKSENGVNDFLFFIFFQLYEALEICL